ncbi:MAG TPA: hypothetical protein VGD14_04360 [bacterium]
MGGTGSLELCKKTIKENKTMVNKMLDKICLLYYTKSYKTHMARVCGFSRSASNESLVEKIYLDIPINDSGEYDSTVVFLELLKRIHA